MADPFTIAALAYGASQLVSGGFNYLGARRQAQAAERAAKEARRTGREARDIIAESTPLAARQLGAGFDAASNRLGDVDILLQGGQQQLEDTFAQEREVGSAALQRLNDVLLGGDISQLQIDPGFEFRRQQGEQAIQRQAAAAGSFGGGGNLRDFARFNQGLASQEFGNAIGRLQGLQQVGSQANAQFAQLNQSLLGARAGVGQNQANVAQNRGSALAQLTQTSAANQANALANQSANVNAFNLQAANAEAAGLGGIGNTVGNAGELLFLLSALRGQQQQQQQPRTTFSTDFLGIDSPPGR